MSEKSSVSLPVRITSKFILNSALAWFLATYFSDMFVLTGAFTAYVIVGALLTLLNIFIRPILDIVTIPLKLFATILAIIVVNGVFVQMVASITTRMNPEMITLTIEGGLIGWTVIAIAFGIANWLAKVILR